MAHRSNVHCASTTAGGRMKFQIPRVLTLLFTASAMVAGGGEVPVLSVAQTVPDACSLGVYSQATCTPVMSGLDSPRGLAFGPEGALYVTEAGRGAGVVASPATDLRCFPGPAGGLTCYGPTGAVSRLWHGEQTRGATGLPSIAQPNGSRGTGATDIVFGRGHAYITMGMENNPTFRHQFPHIPELATFASLVHLSAGGEWRVVADVGAFEEANNPDGRLTADGSPHLDTNP